MYIYFHYSREGNQTLQAFHKPEKAAEYVIVRIESHISSQEKYRKNLPRLTINDIGPRGELHYWPQPGVPEPALVDVGAIAQQQIIIDPPVPVIARARFADPVPATKKAAKKEEPKDISPELQKLKFHLEIAKKNMTLENAIHMISLYEDYSKYILNSESPIHSLTDVKIVE